MSPDTYRSTTGVTIRVVGNDILVKTDELPERTAGGLYIPENAGERGEMGLYNTGTVLAVGWMTLKKARVPIPDVRPGMRCVFVRFLSEQHSNKQLHERLENNVIRIKASDILVLFDPEDTPRVRGGM